MANRQTVTARLEQILTGRSPNRILLLSATSNSGKTHLLAQVRAHARRLQIPCFSVATGKRETQHSNTVSAKKNHHPSRRKPTKDL
jgi:hypothetical protein